MSSSSMLHNSNINGNYHRYDESVDYGKNVGPSSEGHVLPWLAGDVGPMTLPVSSQLSRLVPEQPNSSLEQQQQRSEYSQ